MTVKGALLVELCWFCLPTDHHRRVYWDRSFRGFLWG